MIPIFVTVQGGFNYHVDGKSLRGHMSGKEAGISLREADGNCTLDEPFNGTTVSMASKGLNAINVIVNGPSVHVVGNYEFDMVPFRCCVTLCGTTACGDSACVTCDNTTACCQP